MILFFCVSTIFSQQPLFRNYILKDGLPSNETYHIISDKKGYLWIATDAGICKFDGYKFKIFGENEGLSEAVVLKLYEDRTGKIWFSTLSARIGYIYHDKVCMLKDVSKETINREYFSPYLYIYSFYLDKKKTLWLGTIGSGQILKIPYPYKKRLFIESRNNLLLQMGDKYHSRNYIYCSVNESINSKGFYFSENNCFVKGKKKSSYIKTSNSGAGKLFIKHKNGSIYVAILDKLYQIKGHSALLLKKFKHHIVYLSFDCKDQLWVGLKNEGAFCFPKITRYPTFTYKLFDGITISSVTIDKEGGYWFSSLEKGILYLPSNQLRLIGSKNDISGKKINSIASISKDTILVQESRGDLFVVTKSGINPIYNSTMSVLYNQKYPGKVFLGGDVPGILNLINYKFTKITATNNIVYYSRLFKSDEEGNIYTFYPKILFRMTNSFMLNPVFISKERINDVYYDTKRKVFWIGTNAGLISYQEGRKAIYWKYKIKQLGHRIDKIIEDKDGDLWLATRGNGLYIFDKKDKIDIINEDNGLPSNFCRILEIDSFDHMWVGTNSGLSMVNVENRKVSNFSFLNDLVSGEINDIKRIDNKLWVATGEGLYQFLISELDRIKLKTPIYITKVSTQYRDTLQSLSQLKYNENFLKFSFIGLSYYNAGKLTYSYKLSPIDTTWRHTNDLSTEYFNLPSGDYKFIVKVASNSDNIKNPETLFKFSIHPPFWKTWWFIFIVLSVTISMTILFFNYKVRQVRNKEKEKGKVQLLLAKMEAKALRAQMSPHFIFNALNSIQNFILKNENRSAHEFLSKFARLMRNILDGSNAEFITLEKEIDTLRLYIQLEKMRASYRFDFEFIVDKKLHISNVFIPSMILQPFIENAILHGLFPKSEANGILKITFISEDDQIRCIVEDNGIGRNKAKEINDKKQQYHKSMGMSVTHDRIEKLKKINKLNAEYMIHDLFDEYGNSIGTKVVLVLPIKENNS